MVFILTYRRPCVAYGAARLCIGVIRSDQYQQRYILKLSASVAAEVLVFNDVFGREVIATIAREVGQEVGT